MEAKVGKLKENEKKLTEMYEKLMKRYNDLE